MTLRTTLFLAGLLVSLTPAPELQFRHHFVSLDLPVSAEGTGDYGLTALVDLDKDGRLDFVTGGRFVKPSTLYWFEYQAPDRWARHVVGTDYQSDVGLAALDVDGDGWTDLVCSGKAPRGAVRTDPLRGECGGGPRHPGRGHRWGREEGHRHDGGRKHPAEGAVLVQDPG